MTSSLPGLSERFARRAAWVASRSTLACAGVTAMRAAASATTTVDTQWGTATHYTLGPGAVSLSGSIVTSSANDVTVTGTSAPSDCSAAFTTLKSVAPTSPI